VLKNQKVETVDIDIFSIEGSQDDDTPAIAVNATNFKCYYCNDNFQTNDVTEYLRHGVIHHPDKPL
jgi:hypothetical protein